MTAAELVAALTERRVLLGGRRGELAFRGPRSVLTAEVVASIRKQRAEIIDLLGRTRFTRAELDALGYVGTRCRDGSGYYEVAIDGSIGSLVMRLRVFGVEPIIHDGTIHLRSASGEVEDALPENVWREVCDRVVELEQWALTRPTSSGSTGGAAP